MDTITERTCRLCGEPEGERPFRRPNECDTCRRYGERFGLTECCGARPVKDEEQRYCPACPGEGKTQLVLISPSGKERVAYHPETVALPGTLGALTLADYARLRGTRVDSLVLVTADERAWHLGLLRLRDVPRRVVVEACARCGRSGKRWVTRVNRSDLCDPCHSDARRERQKKNKRNHVARTRALGLSCPLCGRSPVPRLLGSETGEKHCNACDLKIRRHGRCTRCSTPRTAIGCSKCDPPPPRRTVRITVTDGEELREVEVSPHLQLGRNGGTAQSYLAPVVLVPSLPAPGEHSTAARSGPACLPLAQGVVISGLRLPHAGVTARLGLLALQQAGLPESHEAAMEALREQFPPSEATGVAGQLTRAGLLGPDGVTERGRSVLAWARSAGVRL